VVRAARDLVEVPVGRVEVGPAELAGAADLGHLDTGSAQLRRRRFGVVDEEAGGHAVGVTAAGMVRVEDLEGVAVGELENCWPSSPCLSSRPRTSRVNADISSKRAVRVPSQATPFSSTRRD
jgi:hypothetical protein